MLMAISNSQKWATIDDDTVWCSERTEVFFDNVVIVGKFFFELGLSKKLWKAGRKKKTTFIHARGKIFWIKYKFFFNSFKNIFYRDLQSIHRKCINSTMKYEMQSRKLNLRKKYIESVLSKYFPNSASEWFKSVFQSSICHIFLSFSLLLSLK